MWKNLVNQFNSLFVNAYKLMGFAVLTAILVGIVSYLGMSLFYLVDREWVAPIILSPSSERVIQMNSQLIQQKYNHDKLEVERMMLETQLRSIERTLAVNRTFQERFKKAISADRAVKQRELKGLSKIYGEYLATKTKVQEANEAFTKMSEQDLKKNFEAGLVDEDGYIRTKFALSQSITNKIAYDQKQVDFESRKLELERKIASLRTLEDRLSQTDSIGEHPNYDVLLMEKEYQNSLLEAAELESQKQPIVQQIAMLDSSMEQYDKILATIQQSPYYKAMTEKVSIAFSPYSNLHNIRQGAPIYGCSLELIWCHKVGEVVKLLDGEISARHPMFSSELRGVMVEIKLDDMTWAEEQALHVDSKPLLI